MSSFAKISIRFGADLKQFSSQMQNAQRQMQQVGKKMQNVGRNLTIGVTAPIVALGYKSVIAFDKQAKAIAQVEAGVKSTGKAAGFATEELLKMASELQNKTIFGDEEILQGATAQLLTFTNIAGQQFERTQLAALNLATRLDGDLKSASIQLGKALNDPVANLSALSRSGIQFSTEQKAVIKQLAETNRLADAQTIILDELEKQYGGAAEAAAKAGTGPFKQLSNTLGDILEDFGAIISEALLPFITKLKDLADRFKNLDPAVKKTIVAVAGLAAALGPVLLTMGFMVANIIPAMAAGFTALTGPIGLVIAAIAGIAYVVYENWDRIKKEFNELRNYFVDLYNESIVFRAGIEAVILVFKSMYDVVKLVLDFVVTGFKNGIEFILGSVKNLGKAFKAILTGNFSEIPKILMQQGKLAGDNFKNLIGDVSNDLDKFTTNIRENVNNAVDAVTLRKKVAFSEANVDASAIQKAVNNAVNGGLSGTGGRGQVQSVNEGITAESMRPIQQGPLDIIAERMPAQAAKMSEVQMQVLANAQAFNEGLAEITQNTVANFAEGFGQLIGTAAQGGLNLKGIAKLILVTLADMAINVGKMAIGIGTAVEGIKKALQSLAGPVAIAAGVALIALGTFAKSALANAGSQNYEQPRRAFADGGIVYGPTNALIGEYSGARSNPEIVAPLDKLKNMISDVTGGGELKGSIQLMVDGKDLKASLDNTNLYLGRRG